LEEKESLRKAVEDFETMMRKRVMKAARRSPEDFPDELALQDLAPSQAEAFGIRLRTSSPVLSPLNLKQRFHL